MRISIGFIRSNCDFLLLLYLTKNVVDERCWVLWFCPDSCFCTRLEISVLISFPWQWVLSYLCSIYLHMFLMCTISQLAQFSLNLNCTKPWNLLSHCWWITLHLLFQQNGKQYRFLASHSIECAYLFFQIVWPVTSTSRFGFNEIWGACNRYKSSEISPVRSYKAKGHSRIGNYVDAHALLKLKKVCSRLINERLKKKKD